MKPPSTMPWFNGDVRTDGPLRLVVSVPPPTGWTFPCHDHEARP